MPRFHAIEFEDFSWFPSILRNPMTDFYHSQMMQFGLYEPAVAHLKTLMDETGFDNSIDLCSGGTGPNAYVQEELAKQHNKALRITLTDKFPNLPAFEKIAQSTQGKISFQTDAIDATDVPKAMKGIRTLYSSFHHFKPDQAKSILQDAVDKQAPIAVFELANRSLAAHLQSLLGTPVGLAVFTPFIKPLSLTRFIFTYLIPLLPLLIIWDGIASNCRAYSPKEMNALIKDLKNAESFIWGVGIEKSTIPGARVTYLTGRPK